MVHTGTHSHQATPEALLTKAGLKATKPRKAILEAFLKSKKPLDIKGLEMCLPQDVHTATLYRAVERLVQAGVLLQVNLGTESAHFEIKDDAHHHHHAICTDCGRIEDVQLCESTELEKEVLRSLSHFRTLNAHSLEFFGQCVSCIKK